MVTGGVGGMGGAQPLSVTLNEGVVLAIDVDRTRIERRVETRYCDVIAENLDEALGLCEAARRLRVGRFRLGWWVTAPRCCRSWCGAA